MDDYNSPFGYDPLGFYNVLFCDYEITNVALKKENGAYYLDVTLTYDRDDGKHEVHIPYIGLLPNNSPVIRLKGDFNASDDIQWRLEMPIDGPPNYLVLPIKKIGDKYAVAWTDTLIDPRIERMTKADIEQALGYKIEIIEEDEKT